MFFRSLYLELRGARSVEVFAVIGKLRGMSRKRVRYTIDVHFGSHKEKAAFVCRLKRVRELLSPEDGPPLEWFSSRGIIIYIFALILLYIFALSPIPSR